MAKKKSKRKSGVGTDVIVIVGLGAVMVALGLIVLSGGLAAPAAPVSAASLETCNGKSCPSRGDPNAPVTLIEISDAACPHCRDFNLLTEPILDAEYVATGKVKYVSHIFGFRAETQAVAAAALCANEQGKYWEFQRSSFQNQPADRYATRDDILRWGQAAGLETGAFSECVAAGRYTFDAQASSLEAQRAGISSTPSFFVNDQLILGNVPLEQFRRELDAALAGG